jgi:hypothetical protein
MTSMINIMILQACRWISVKVNKNMKDKKDSAGLQVD